MLQPGAREAQQMVITVRCCARPTIGQKETGNKSNAIKGLVIVAPVIRPSLQPVDSSSLSAAETWPMQCVEVNRLGQKKDTLETYRQCRFSNDNVPSSSVREINCKPFYNKEKEEFETRILYGRF